MDFIYGTSVFDQFAGDMIQTPLVNMYVEQSPTEQRPVLMSRPGISNLGLSPNTMGNGPVTALFQMDGVLNGDVFGLSTNLGVNQLYRDPGTPVGTVDGTDLGNIDCFPVRIFCNKGKSVFAYDGTTFSTVAMPGGFDVTDICVAASRLICLKKNSGTFYWSDALSNNVGALNFATAEQYADNLLGCLYLEDTLILFGSKSVEFWPVTQDPNAPFQPVLGKTYNVGMKNTRCMTPFAGTFAWITNQARICVGSPNKVISTPALEEKLDGGTTLSLFRFMMLGEEFLALRLDGFNKTYVYNSKSATWSEFRTFGLSNWAVRCWCRVQSISGGLDTHRFGSATDGKLYIWNPGNYTDGAATSNNMERTFRAGYPLDGQTLRLDNIQLRTNPGFSIGANIGMRTSKDGGQSFGTLQNRTLYTGIPNDFRSKVQWRSQGMFSHPGILCEFTMTNTAHLRVSGVTGNEQYADVGL